MADNNWVVHVETVLKADESNHAVYGPYTKDQADELAEVLPWGPEVHGVHVLRLWSETPTRCGHCGRVVDPTTPRCEGCRHAGQDRIMNGATMTHPPGGDVRPTYQLAMPSLNGQDAVCAILDYASMELEFTEDGKPTDPSLFDGICGALGSILSSDETPADLLILEACTGARAAS